jgi:hypothetical protein
MNEQDNLVPVRLVKKDGKLAFQNNAAKLQHQEFVGSLVEGQSVSVLFEAYKDDGTNLQLAKIHACIRKLAADIGYTFEAMKLEIKRRSGLVVGDLTVDGYAKSFADCSVEELGLVISSIIEAGDFININFRGKFPEQNHH